LSKDRQIAAIDKKLEDQDEFVKWWRGAVRSPGGKETQAIAQIAANWYETTPNPSPVSNTSKSRAGLNIFRTHQRTERNCLAKPIRTPANRKLNIQNLATLTPWRYPTARMMAACIDIACISRINHPIDIQMNGQCRVSASS
jgi:hypothetical protein